MAWQQMKRKNNELSHFLTVNRYSEGKIWNREMRNTMNMTQRGENDTVEIRTKRDFSY